MSRRADPKTGTKRLSEVARHVVKPSGIVRTGWGPVRDTCRDKLGVTFDAWQDGCGRIILAERADGTLAVMVGGVGMSFPRQVGKTYLLTGLIFGLCLNKPGLLVIWSAHHARTHGETFLSMQAFCNRTRVAPYIEQVYTGSGDEEVRFHNGSRILFGARERGFGRGIPGVDILVMDEAQILSDKALENMLATLNTSKFGLQLYIGTPPKPEDVSEAFTRMRNEAIKGESDESAWIECGAEPGSDIDDREQWAKANPSYPHRTPVQSILRLRKKLTPEGFLREGLGVWDDDDGDTSYLIPGWSDLVNASLFRPVSLGISGDLDRTCLYLGGSDGSVVSLLVPAAFEANGTRVPTSSQDLFVSEVARISRTVGANVLVQRGGPAWHLEDALKSAGVNLTPVTYEDFIEAGADFERRVETLDLIRSDDSDVNADMRRAEWKTANKRKVLTGNVPALEAVVLALHGAASGGSYDPLSSVLL